MKSLSQYQNTNKKGQLGNLQGIVLTLVVVGILIGAGFLILEKFRTEVGKVAADGNLSPSWKGVNDTIGAMQNIPSLLGLIVLVSVIGIVLAVVFNVIPGARTSGA